MSVHLGTWTAGAYAAGVKVGTDTLIFSDSSNPQSVSISMTQYTSAGYQTNHTNHYSWTYTNGWSKFTEGGQFGMYHGTATTSPMWFTVDCGAATFRKFIFKKYRATFSWRTGTAIFKIYGTNVGVNPTASGSWDELVSNTSPASNTYYSFTNEKCYRWLKFEYSGFATSYDWGGSNFEMYGDLFSG